MSDPTSISRAHPEEPALKLSSRDVDSLGTPVRTFGAHGQRPSRPLHSTLMSRIDAIGSGFPLRLAQAYEPQRVQRPVTPVPPVRSVERESTPTQGIESLSQATAARSTPRPEGIRKLVAGRVDVPISFPSDDLASRPRAAVGSPLAMYAAPADRNTAATAVNVGRSLDVTA